MSIINAGLEEYRNAFFALNEKLVAKHQALFFCFLNQI